MTETEPRWFAFLSLSCIALPVAHFSSRLSAHKKVRFLSPQEYINAASSLLRTLRCEKKMSLSKTKTLSGKSLLHMDRTEMLNDLNSIFLPGRNTRERETGHSSSSIFLPSYSNGISDISIAELPRELELPVFGNIDDGRRDCTVPLRLETNDFARSAITQDGPRYYFDPDECLMLRQTKTQQRRVTWANLESNVRRSSKPTQFAPASKKVRRTEAPKSIADHEPIMSNCRARAA